MDYILLLGVVAILLFLVPKKSPKIVSTDPATECPFYMMTIQRKGEAPKTIFYCGSVIRFLLIEESLGRFETAILYAKEITEQEYTYYHKNSKG